MLKLAEHVGLTDAINNHVRLLKSHAPYHESDHVLAMVMNVLCNGSRLEHLERLRNDSTFLDAIGADSIPIRPLLATFAVASNNLISMP